MTADRLVLRGVLGAVALWLLWRHLWRALWVLRPSGVQVEADAPADQMALPEPLLPVARALEGLGFVALGRHEERPPLRRATPLWDYAHPQQPLYATLELSAEGAPRLTLLTPLQEGGFVLTSSFRRPARERPGYLAGGVPGAGPERLVRAHLLRLAGHPPAALERTLEGRVALARRWYAGAGAAEVRQAHLQGLVWTLGALLVLGAVLFGER